MLNNQEDVMNKSRIAGILSIVSGGLGIGTSLIYVIIIVFFSLVMRMPGFMPDVPGTDEYMANMMFTMMIIIYSVIAAVMIIAGILAIVGGVFALKKKNWGVALAGSIGSIIAFMPCGIASIIFIIMGKEEFQSADSSITSQD
jgi:hypothetical protein